jgi:hypothetical protein
LNAQSDIAAAGSVLKKRILTDGCVKVAGGVDLQRIFAVGGVFATGGVSKERFKTIGRVVVAGGVVSKRTISRGGTCGLARSPGSLTHPGMEVDRVRRELAGRRGAALL